MQYILEVIYENWLPLTVGLLGAVAGVAVWMLWRRRSRGGLPETFAAISVEVLDDILLPDGMGGEIHLEHLLLTGHGLVVLDVKRVTGTVFASDRMDEWTVINREHRFSFQNPQAALYDRVAALRLVVRDVPIAGHVLFTDEADFSKGRPRDVILSGELAARYGRPEKADLERIMEAFYPHWERVRKAARPASTATDSA